MAAFLVASSVVGPRDFAPLRRLASARALLIATAARGAAPALDVAVILGWRWGLEVGVDAGEDGRGAGLRDSVSLTPDRNSVQRPTNQPARRQPLHGPEINEVLTIHR
jgi:hypothetical protein